MNITVRFGSDSQTINTNLFEADDRPLTVGELLEHDSLQNLWGINPQDVSASLTGNGPVEDATPLVDGMSITITQKAHDKGR